MNLRQLLTFCMILGAFPSAGADQVRVYEQSLSIPTYRIGEGEILPRWNPHFGKIYPYPMLDKLTDFKYDRTCRALWLENEYVKVLVLPEIGGRMHGAQDKTNGYQFMFDQKTIKPALVGRGGAWISGGIEWNFPDGHRVSGFRDTDWRIVENPDGSRTIWTGEIERVFGMRWSVGNTVHPGRNWIETKVRLFNCTPYPHSFLYWADSGVRGTPEFQAVIPGEISTGHGKHRFFHWPIHNGVDLRKWKNAPGGTSYFAWESESDYFGTWNPEDNGGLVHWADHHIVRGKKLWFCGTSPAGRLWEVVLTDGDLPLVEPQAGAYSDNQPDYLWIMPGETKIFSHYWFPVRDIGPWDYANLEGTLALKLEKNKVKIGWSPTGENADARVILCAADREFYSRTIDAGPGTPFTHELVAPEGADLYSLKMTVLSSAGDTLLFFQHPVPENPPLPEPDPPFPPAEKLGSQDSLFLIGDHLERFRQPDRAIGYYREALRRDPEDVRTNTAMGLVHLKRGLYAEALQLFAKALNRQPSFARARYYQGLAELWLGRFRKAEKNLNLASYYLAHYAAAHFELAQLTASQGRLERALDHIERSIRGNADNAQAHAVKALILNRLGRHEKALAVASEVQNADPLDFLSLAEQAVALEHLGRKPEAEAARDTLLGLTRGSCENHLELAIRYTRCGLYGDAARVLRMITDQPGYEKLSPMAYYYLGYYYDLLGKKLESNVFRTRASEVCADYCFPSRLESVPVLRFAMEKNPQDARAFYLLGTLYFSKDRVDDAIRVLQRSVSLDPGNVVAQRNLGYAWVKKKDLERARTAYEAALETNHDLPLAILELDRVYHDLGLSAEQRASFLEKHREQAFKSDPLLKRLISLYVQLERYDNALEALTSHRFHSWEGRYGVHLYWVQSRIKKGDFAFEAGDYKKALEHYRLALAYPSNLEVEEQPGTIHARKRYKFGLALEALGRGNEAREEFEKVVKDRLRPNNAYQYFRGKALDKLGRKDEARKVYQGLLNSLEKPGISGHIFAAGPGRRLFGGRQAEALIHFKRALALEGLENHREAEKERKKALELDSEVEMSAFCPPEAGW